MWWNRRRKIADASHYFIDGFAPREDLIGLIAYPNCLEGTQTDYTTFYMATPNEWGYRTLEFDACSVTYHGPSGEGEWWILNKHGRIARIGKNVRFDKIPFREDGLQFRGYLTCIASVGEQLYVCGDERQIYIRECDEWRDYGVGMHLPETCPPRRLNALDGLAGDCLYTVGDCGEIWHFNGTAWRLCASRCGSHLYEVRCIAPDRVLVAGRHGRVMIGAGKHWTDYHAPEFMGDLWGVEEFKGTVYVAGTGGLACLKNGRIEPLDPGIGKPITSRRLRAADGYLWSIGRNHLLRFDGDTWAEILCPNNT